MPTIYKNWSWLASWCIRHNHEGAVVIHRKLRIRYTRNELGYADLSTLLLGKFCQNSHIMHKLKLGKSKHLLTPNDFFPPVSVMVLWQPYTILATPYIIKFPFLYHVSQQYTCSTKRSPLLVDQPVTAPHYTNRFDVFNK